MKIIECNLLEDEKMYCPSTNEVLYDPETGEFNLQAEALIASWHHEVIDEPETAHEELLQQWKNYWEQHYHSEEEEEQLLPNDVLTNFIRTYDSTDWIAYECTLRTMGCGPYHFTVWCMVKADTVVG